MEYTPEYSDTQWQVHFAVMAIETSARKACISGKEMHERLILRVGYTNVCFAILRYGLQLMSDKYLVDNIIRELS